jgi:hypothetical protein
LGQRHEKRGNLVRFLLVWPLYSNPFALSLADFRQA